MVGRIVKIALVAGLAAMVLGIYIGNRLPYGDTHLKTVDAKAKLEDPGTGLGLADAIDGDEQFAFNVHEIRWTSAVDSGDGDPPCLRKPGKYADVEIGYTDVALPDGRTVEEIALWIRCP